MSDLIEVCGRCDATQAPPIEGFIPFTGELREYVATRICAACWSQWQNTQLMAINEYRLNLGKPEHQQVLRDLASEFFRFGAVGVPAAGEAAATGGASLDHLGQVWTPPKDEG